MSYVLIHRDPATTLLADDPVIPKRDVGRLKDGLGLLERLRSLGEAAETRIKERGEAAHETGWSRGYQEGAAEARREYAELFTTLERAATRDHEESRRQSVVLALEVVRRIAGEVGENEFLSAIAEKAVHDLVPDGAVLVRVHPDRLDAVRSKLAGQGARLEIEADDALGPTDCVLVSSFGRIEAGLETQLAALEHAFREAGHG